MAEWYVKHGDTTHGPFSSSQLKQLADSGRIDRDTAVRKNADGKWSAERHGSVPRYLRVHDETFVIEMNVNERVVHS